MLIIPNLFSLKPLREAYPDPLFPSVFIFYSGLILVLGLALFRTPRTFFICLSPFALLVIPYSYVLVLFSSIPGKSFLEIIFGTTIREIYGLILYLNWYLLIPLIYFLSYLFLSFKLDSKYCFNTSYRKYLLLISLVFVLLGVLGKQFWSKKYPLDGILNEALVVSSYPLGIIINLSQYLTQEKVTPLTYSRLKIDGPKDDNQQQTVVLVVGESLRGDHLSINGYHRNTTPALELRQEELVSFLDVTSYSNSTHQSVPRLLSHTAGEGKKHSLVQTFKEAGYKTAWVSNQIREIYSPAADYEEFSESTWADLFRKDYDMLPAIQGILNQHGKKQFIVVHMLGSHVDYDARYTKAETVFSPRYSDIDAAINSTESQSALVNSYDNTIVAMDSFIDRIISILEQYGGDSTLIYTSDHGENLFDDSRNLFMHSSPIPSIYEVRVPLIVWCGKACQKKRPRLLEKLAENRSKKISHKNVFFTVLDIAGFKLPKDARKSSLFDSNFEVAERWVFPTLNERINVSDLY